MGAVRSPTAVLRVVERRTLRALRAVAACANATDCMHARPTHAQKETCASFGIWGLKDGSDAYLHINVLGHFRR